MERSLMRFRKYFPAVIVIAVSGWQSEFLRADEPPVESVSTGADEKADATETKDAAAALRETIRKAPPAEAIKVLEEAIALSPDDMQIPLMRQGLVARLTSAGDVPGAIEQAEKLMAFHLSHVADNDPAPKFGVFSTANSLRSLYLRANQPKQASAVTQTALNTLRSAAKEENVNIYVSPILELVEIVTAEMTSAGKFSAAEELLSAECASTQQWILAADPPDSGLIIAWCRLMQRRVYNADRAESDQAAALAAELDARILAAVEKQWASPALLLELIRVRSAEISRIYRDEPAAAQELLNRTTEFVNASELKDNQSINKAVTRLQALERRIAAALQILEMIGKPAPILDIQASVHGAAVDPEHLKGKVVLLDFWAVWCGPCIATFPHLKEWHEEFHDKGLEIVGVTREYGYEWNEESTRATKAKGEVTSEDELAMLDKFMSHHELPHATIVTPKGSELQKQYGVTGIPHVVLIDRQGNVRMVKVGSGPANAKALHKTIVQLLAE